MREYINDMYEAFKALCWLLPRALPIAIFLAVLQAIVEVL